MTAVLTHPDMLDTTLPVYGRADALRDGVLVDISQIGRKLGFKHPLAITQSAWLDSVLWDDEVEARKSAPCMSESTDGRLREVVWHALCAARVLSGSRLTFVVSRVPADAPGPQAKDQPLTLTIGPGDDLRPVLTISMPGEF